MSIFFPSPAAASFTPRQRAFLAGFSGTARQKFSDFLDALYSAQAVEQEALNASRETRPARIDDFLSALKRAQDAEQSLVKEIQKLIKKRCPRCGEIKPIDEFGRNKNQRDGYRFYCLPCSRKLSKKYRIKRSLDPERAEKYRQYQRQHALRYQRARRKIDPEYVKYHILKNREFYDRNPGNVETRRRKNRERYPRYKDRMIQYNESRRDGNENRAREAVRNAFRRGDIPHPTTLKCSWPGCDKQARQYHHESYEPENWLKVIPFCSKHHGEKHRKPLG